MSYESHPGLPSYVEECRPGQKKSYYNDKFKFTEEESELFWGEATTIFETYDPDASYSYDDSALVQVRQKLHDGTETAKYYFINTSGCSCPSPSETWRVVFTAPTLGEAVSRWLSDQGTTDWSLAPGYHPRDYSEGIKFRPSHAQYEIYKAFKAHGLII